MILTQNPTSIPNMALLRGAKDFASDIKNGLVGCKST